MNDRRFDIRCLLPRYMPEEDSVSPLLEKLNLTGKKISSLSNKVAGTTKNAISATNDAVKKVVSDSKDKLDERREKKAEKAKSEIKSAGIIDDIPPMVALPEFENERMEIVNEQHESQILMLEHMQRLSERVDILERRHKARLEELFDASTEDIEEDDELLDAKQEIIGASEVMVETLHILGASMMWIVALIGLDRFMDGKNLMINSVYPAGAFVWSIGAFSWVLYLFYRLSKSGIKIPLLIRIQTSLAVGLITVMGVLLNDESATVTSVWTWGTLVTLGLLIGSSMVATAWKTTKKVVGIKGD